ncbi:MAG: phosphoribosylamine--glycine ligase, partial [Calditrichia bacterium]|nr:phosphoribosylamine--glycine ligase [Calditrichia bacterium]
VVKADGLAAGKGVIVAKTFDEAADAIERMLLDEVFGAAGNRVIFEEMMTGEEASIFALSDGENYVILPSAQDHKRALDGDKGKNTGGMGAYSPAPIITDSILEKVEKEIIAPTIKAMKIEGVPFSGCLYAGLMLTESGPKVVEFNCRFGDPETQVVLPLIEDDLFNIIKEIADGQLKTTKVINKEESAICVVLASGGYPGKYENNMVISGLDDTDVNENYIIFHAGTKFEDDKFLTNGGRVLNVVTSAQNLKEAFDQVYNCVKKIKFDNMHYRTDIALRGLNK